jgi:hypothetical protein
LTAGIGLQKAMETVLRAHEPYPALAIDRHWDLVTLSELALETFFPADDATASAMRAIKPR